MKVSFTLVSSNAKTGPIPVSTTEPKSCPASCPLKHNGCYAGGGPLALHWKRVVTAGMEWHEFCAAVRRLLPGTLWRHNQAGDLPGNGIVLDELRVAQLVDANRLRRGFTYTHYPLGVPRNAALVRFANSNGFTINASCERAADAVILHKAGLPSVTLQAKPGNEVVDGVHVVTCPAVTHGKTCAACGLCQRADRRFVIGFPVHGSQKKKALNLVT